VAKEAADRAILAARKAGAGEASATIHASRHGFTRFAAGTATQAGEVERREIHLHVELGLRHATLSGEDLSADALATLGERAVEKMKAAPEDPEHLPLAGPQEYPLIAHAWDDATAEADPVLRARAVRAVLDVARESSLVAAGFHEVRATELTRASTTGARGTHRRAHAALSVTLRRPDGSASGWAGARALKVGELHAERLARTAVDRAARWKDPLTLTPGGYTVILEPAAVQDLVSDVVASMERRAADEGRSAFSKPGGGTREGERMFARGVTITADPSDAIAPGDPWAEGGFAARRHVYVEDGVVKGLHVGRHWAKKQGLQATFTGSAFHFHGGKQSLTELVAGCEKGLLVSHLWYVRSLDPRTVTVTGLSRDAVFLVEKGRVTRAVKSFRFNQSLLAMLANVEAIGPAELAHGGNDAVPSLRIRDFQISSVSEAI
jgi:predicted Zn-dependent protease